MQTAAAKRPPGQNEYLPQLDPQRMAETLTALANSGGGTLVLGMTPQAKCRTGNAEEDATDALAAALRLPPFGAHRMASAGDTKRQRSTRARSAATTARTGGWQNLVRRWRREPSLDADEAAR